MTQESKLEKQQATRLGWPELQTSFEKWVNRTYPDGAHAETSSARITHQFAMGRVEEGRGVGQWFLRHGHAGRVLDIGAGNGGAALGMANFAAFDVAAADIVINQDLFSLRRDVPLPVTQVAANGHNLPFRSATFDIILCLDTVEHVPQPELLAAEIMRVLRRGGLCMITTPARLRHLFGRDPHYGIPGLLLLPDRLQRAVGSFLLERTTSYDVEHIFWSVDEITSLFSRHAPVGVDVLWNHNWPGPVSIREFLWHRYRHWWWDRIVIRKE